MAADLRLGGYSPSTRKIYLLYAKLYMRSPAAMGEQEIRQYLLHMVEQKKISRETYRQMRIPVKRATRSGNKMPPREWSDPVTASIAGWLF